MTAFNMHIISNALEINAPSLARAYTATIKEMAEDYEQRGLLRKILKFSGDENEQVITYAELAITLKGTYRFVFRDTKMFLKWTFKHDQNDETQDVLTMLIDDDGIIFVGDIDSGEVLNYNEGNLAFKIFERITKAAYDNKLFY
ncbi:hypothetical protein MXF20_11255 [Pantoea dispersa]|uniref:hypothetical protein n=1 Tax=Pantoea dispersa TaxID=59814 RepID=UPI002DB7214D|nr:hypothetical protein [Pantoea dispersa]MEB5972662.1 hypothetical protein [Pantoea dispersa]